MPTLGSQIWFSNTAGVILILFPVVHTNDLTELVQTDKHMERKVAEATEVEELTSAVI